MYYYIYRKDTKTEVIAAEHYFMYNRIMTLEELTKNSRFVYIVYRDFGYLIEVNRMHAGGGYSMNVRGSGETIEEALRDLKKKLQTIEQP